MEVISIPTFADADKEAGESPISEVDTTETGRLAEPKVEWEERYKQSSREAKRLLDENRRLQETAADVRAKAASLEKEKQELEDLARGTNPEGYDTVKLRKHIETLSADLAHLKEGQELDAFVSQVPEAARYRETLKDLGRTYTGRSYRDIWDTTLKSVAEAAGEAANAKSERRNSAPDMGKGSPTGEPNQETVCGMPIEKFNKLSLEKRKELFKKNNIHFTMPS